MEEEEENTSDTNKTMKNTFRKCMIVVDTTCKLGGFGAKPNPALSIDLPETVGKIDGKAYVNDLRDLSESLLRGRIPKKTSTAKIIL